MAVRDETVGEKHYDPAISLEPGHSDALRPAPVCTLRVPIWDIGDPGYRNGTAALKDARILVLDLARDNNVLGSDWIQRSYLQTLAAAQDECNDFDSAIALQKDVLEKLCTTRPANETAREPLDRLGSNMPIPEESGPVS